MVTLDGYFEGVNHSIEWHNVDHEFNEFVVDQLDSAGILLFGRNTYELMAGYWPTLSATTDEPIVAYKMNTISKIVISTTLEKAAWENTRLISKNIENELRLIKNSPGKDIFILGSASLSSMLREMGMIDEYRIMINPVAIGQGKQLFSTLNETLNFRLLKTRKFKSGNVLLYYEPKKD